MLQVPYSGPSRRTFTKAQIADMSRGGKVVVRSMKKPTDPVLKHVRDLYAAREAFIKTRSALIAFIKASQPGECEKPAVYLPPGVLMAIALSVEDRCFWESAHIDRWAKQHRIHYRAIVRGKPKGNTHIVSRAAAKKYLVEIDALVPRLKRALRDIQTAKRILWAHSGYQKLMSDDTKAQNRFWELRNALPSVNPKSVAGAYALIEVIEKFSVIPSSQESYCVLHPHQRQQIARNALAALRRLNPEQ